MKTPKPPLQWDLPRLKPLRGIADEDTRKFLNKLRKMTQMAEFISDKLESGELVLPDELARSLYAVNAEQIRQLQRLPGFLYRRGFKIPNLSEEAEAAILAETNRPPGINNGLWITVDGEKIWTIWKHDA